MRIAIIGELCVATKILNLKAIPSGSGRLGGRTEAVRCNKNTKSESYSQYGLGGTNTAWGCALQQKY
ncbi:hypothetical protein CS374_01750 [Porphyromonas gingivalis]|nr:hypothetical protein CS374_01750 [Porphyromonas gingivalis]